MLVVHLKRFQQVHVNFYGRKSTPTKSAMGAIFGNGGSGSAATSSPYPMLAGSAKKLDDYVAFPERFDLRPFLAPKKEKFGLDARGRTMSGVSGKPKGQRHHWMGWGGAEEESEDSPVMYRLYAVVVHIGSMVCDVVLQSVASLLTFSSLLAWWTLHRVYSVARCTAASTGGSARTRSRPLVLRRERHTSSSYRFFDGDRNSPASTWRIKAAECSDAAGTASVVLYERYDCAPCQSRRGHEEQGLSTILREGPFSEC